MDEVDCEQLDCGIRFATSIEEDEKNFECAVKSSVRHNVMPRLLRDRYNFYANNCSDAAVGVASCGINVPNSLSPFPNI